MEKIFDDAAWIWTASTPDEPHQYACFRKDFNVSADAQSGCLYIAADSDFIVILNGLELGRGQFSDYPQDKTYSEFNCPALLSPGPNVLCILAYYCGENFFTYRKGQAGIIVVLQAGTTRIVSDCTWKGIRSPAFQSGGLPKLTPQLGYVTQFDARTDCDWTNPAFDVSSWPLVSVRADGLNGYWKHLSPRPVPPLIMEPRIPTQLIMQGQLFRRAELDTFAVSAACAAR